MTDKIYPAKLLLFGEYTVLNGSGSLAIPFPYFSLRLTNNGEDNYRGLLADFAIYLSKIDFKTWKVSFDKAAYKKALENGYIFKTDIPVGYGAGSSGALCVAVFDSFFKVSEPGILEDHNALKALFGKMESFFHGKSSGMDPLIIYLKHALKTTSKGEVEFVNIDFKPFKSNKLFLIDSGISRSTGEFVNIFHKKVTDPNYRSDYIEPLSNLNSLLIERLTGGTVVDADDLFQFYSTISKLQFDAFREMIPEKIYELWLSVLESEFHAIKLCGAGGGGFFYLFTKDHKTFRKSFPSLKLINISL